MRDPSQAILVLLGSNPGWGWSSSEVLQEVLYYYLRRGQREQALQVMERFDEVLANRVESVTREDVLRAASRDFPPGVESRDRIHLAVMERLGITQIVSADQGFDLVAGIERLDPLALPEWRDEVFSR